MSRKPIAVIAGDIHFTLQTLDLASSVVSQMIAKAKELNVPIILNGDTLDQKAIIRAEVANRVIDLLKEMEPEQVIINTGNHDLCNQHGEESSLNFLRPYAQVVGVPVYFYSLESWIVPYFHDPNKLQEFLATVKPGSRLIMHQGVLGADMGAYMKDNSSLPREAFADFRVIASHYHRKQEIKCGRPRKGAVGLFSFIGSGYTVTSAEAHDGPKGFSVLYSDGLLDLIPTNLRKHVVAELTTEDLKGWSGYYPGVNPGDIIWLKLHGPASELDKINKKELGMRLFGTAQYKLDKLVIEVTRLETPAEKRTDLQILDALIDQTEEPALQKQNLKDLSRELLGVGQ